jgi:hypothetical protein
MKILYISLFISLSLNAQEFYTFDITAEANYVFSELEQGYSIGNDSIEPYSEFNHIGNLDFKHKTLELMNAKLTVYGDILNSGTIIKRFATSQLVVIPNTLAIEEPVVEAVRIYPNPIVNYFFVAGKNLKSITVIDIQGRVLVKQNHVSTLNKIPFEASSGMYFVIITDINNNVQRKKIIVR